MKQWYENWFTSEKKLTDYLNKLSSIGIKPEEIKILLINHSDSYEVFYYAKESVL